MRLDKFLCDNNIGSRSQVKDIIRKSQVKVDGEIIKKPEYKLLEKDGKVLNLVTVNGNEISNDTIQYFMLNKPDGFISATEDKINKTVLDLIDSSRNDLFPVGRLDKDTEGLLIITNDGQLAHKLLSPKKHVDKKYFVKVDSELDDNIIDEFRMGVTINDKSKGELPVILKPALLEICENKTEAYVTISEGKYHQIKRMFSAFDKKVVYLKRISMGSITLDEDLPIGKYRELTNKEIK